MGKSETTDTDQMFTDLMTRVTGLFGKRKFDEAEAAVHDFIETYGIELSQCHVMLSQIRLARGDIEGTIESYVDAGIVDPDTINAFYAGEIGNCISDLTIAAVLALYRVAATKSMDNEIIALGRVLLDHKIIDAGRIVPAGMIDALTRQARLEDAGQVYLECLELGFPIVDYRPRWDRLTPPESLVEETGLDAQRHQIFFSGLENSKKPVPREATQSNETDDSVNAAVTESPTSPVALGATPIGVGSATLFAELSGQTAESVYRFEYGAAPDTLTHATEWRSVPPPQWARMIQFSEDIRGTWIPRATQVEWVISEHRLNEDAKSLCGLKLKSPFAKDRNQLNKIGSHDMPLNINWGTEPASTQKSLTTETEIPISRTHHVSGGAIDLRDAEVSFYVSSEDLELHGSDLTFWINHRFLENEQTRYSQWALTGEPLLSASLKQERIKKLTVKLKNDPTQWSYTGNNPLEQGKRANRYQRTSLNDTLSNNNVANVLIFVHGDDRTPPKGDLAVHAIELLYRDRSVLSQNGNVHLVTFPDSQESEPDALTNGLRGFDDGYWTSDKNPAFPLVWEWRFDAPTDLTAFQINQHPHVPAKQVRVEILKDAEWHVEWEGTLPQGRITSLDKSYHYQKMDNGRAVEGVRLSLLSSYDAEWCGIDGFEVFGTNDNWTTDENTASVSEDITFDGDSEMYWRLALKEQVERRYSTTEKFIPPDSCEPVLISENLSQCDGDPPSLRFRANAMGLETTLSVTCDPPMDGETHLADQSIGCQPTERHVRVNLPVKARAWTGTLHVVLTNKAGNVSYDVVWNGFG